MTSGYKVQPALAIPISFYFLLYLDLTKLINKIDLADNKSYKLITWSVK